MPSPPRVIGTTEGAIALAEIELRRALPDSFRSWLLQNNGKGLGSVTVFPVLDERDKRKTWDSIVRQHRLWQSYCEDVFARKTEQLACLLPFAELGTGDYYCFDYSAVDSTGEVRVVHWSHETGDTTPRGECFADFASRLERGRFELD